MASFEWVPILSFAALYIAVAVLHNVVPGPVVKGYVRFILSLSNCRNRAIFVMLTLSYRVSGEGRARGSAQVPHEWSTHPFARARGMSTKFPFSRARMDLNLRCGFRPLSQRAT